MVDANPAPADAPLRAVLAALSRPAVQLDGTGAVTFVNDAFVAATGWARAEVSGASWEEDLVPANCETRPLIAAAFRGAAGQATGELFTRGGERRVIAWDIVPVRDLGGAVSGVVCLGSDVTTQRHATRERARLARALAATTGRDPDTGLANALGFIRETAHAVRVAARARRADAVLCIRVHGIAAMSAAHGESVADDAVCAVAETLRAVVRDSDVVGRLGADLFAIYAVGTTDPEHGEATAVRVRAALDRQNASARATGRAFDVVCTVAAVERAPGDTIEPWVARAAALVPAAVESASVPTTRAECGVPA